MNVNVEELIKKAYEAKKCSYAPYSGFHVGAALLCVDGTIVTGCNVENAAYSPSNCAERTAVFTAVSQGYRTFRAIAVVGDKEEYLAPCGVCRQVLMEFCDPEQFEIIMAKNERDYRILHLRDLLPFAFSKTDFYERPSGCE